MQTWKSPIQRQRETYLQVKGERQNAIRRVGAEFLDVCAVVSSVTFSTKRNVYLSRNASWTAKQLTKTLKTEAPCFSKTLVFIGFAYIVIIVWYQKCMLYSFFWVFLRRLNFMYRRFGTLCSIFIDCVSGKNNRDETDGYLYRKRFSSKIYTGKDLAQKCLLIVEVSKSHSDTPHSVGLLWTGDQLHAETSTWQHTTFTRDRYPWQRRDSNPQSQQTSRRIPTPWTARSLGSAVCYMYIYRQCAICVYIGNLLYAAR